MKVPFLDLKAQYDSIRPHVDKALKHTIHGFIFIKGKPVTSFEDSFKKILNANHCIAASNGTSSLFIALRSLGIGQGDEVITPSFSWISSSETISLCNAKPVFVDVHPETYTLDPSLIERSITKKTKAIIVVHLYGQAAHVSEIREICRNRGLFLIEDCAQAHLTMENGKAAGTFGEAGAFSFYPTKNLGAYGDAGCIVTGDEELADKMRRFSNHGALQKDDHLFEGINSRMDTIQASVLKAKLPFLKKWNDKRRKNAALYLKLLSSVNDIILPVERMNTRHTWHMFVIRAKKRDELQVYLRKKGVETLIHYPQALTNLGAYSYLSLDPADYPVANLLEKEVLSLPIYPELAEKQIMYACRNIQDFYRKLKSV